MPEGTELVIRTGSHGLVLRNLDEMQRWAEGVQASGLAPDALKTTAQILVATQYGLELGLAPMAALNSICVVSGKPTIYGDAALALVKKSGVYEYCHETLEGKGDAMVAKVESKRKDTGEVVTTTFSVEDAKIAKLWGKKTYKGNDTPWVTHPKRMLKYKARAFNLRDNFPDVLMGMHLTEEMYGEEPLPIPDCKTLPRDHRRKPAQDVKVKDEGEEPQAEPVSDTEGSTDADDTGLYETVVAEFDELASELDSAPTFQEFAIHHLCVEDDEVESPDQFTKGMLLTLQRELKNGIDIS